MNSDNHDASIWSFLVASMVMLMVLTIAVLSAYDMADQEVDLLTQTHGAQTMSP